MDWSGVLFTNKNNWESNPDQASFVYLDGDEELYGDIVDEDSMLPRLACENGVEYFLDVQTFRDVVLKQRELNPASTADEYIYALKYYREYDSFFGAVDAS